MRLTLRTLLAYLDDCLEPTDAQDIGKKIEESEFAANIVHRTRDVMRRLRLGAPRLSGRGMGLDANTVAEYLDNTLADDRVADFEKVCLESDVHLAEVGSCHQIIALALREAADVDIPLRERMYLLSEKAASKPEPEPAAKPEPAKHKQAAAVRQPAAEPAVSTRRKAEVPAYLRQPEETRSWRRPAAVAALAGMLVVVLIMAIDGSWLADLLGFGAKRGGPTPVAQGQPESPQPASAPEEKPAETAAPAATQPKEAEPTESELQQPESVRVATKPQDPPEPTPSAPRDTPENKPEAPATPAATTDTKPVEPANKPAVPATATNTPTKPEVTETPANPPPAAPAGNGAVGRMIAGNQVLLRPDTEAGGWQRVPAQDTIAAGQRLISLPGFRPTITLTNGITLELLGGTSAELQPASEDGTPGISLEFGRVVALTPPKPDVGLRVTVANRRMRVVFGDNGAKVALEANPIHVKGSNPETERPQLMAAMYVAAGKLTLSEGEQSQDVQSPSLVALGNAPVPGNELPDWITVDRLPQSEKMGAEFISDSLTLERPVLGLKELADHRRVEVRTLAVQSLARVGDFEPLVAALNQTDPNFKTIWNDLITDLRAAIARGPETAARVREAFERQRGEKAEALYRMLWGYSTADLKANDGKAVKELVAYLDHSDMDFRALAFWNLRDLTGATRFYQPHLNSEMRKQYVQKWRQWLESGQIFPKVE